MLEQDYQVILFTPLGDRKGLLKLKISKAKINGCLNILGHMESIEGELKKGGACQLRGKIVTLMSEIYYEAVGRIDRESIDLTLHGGQSELKMKGNAVAPTGQSQGGKL